MGGKPLFKSFHFQNVSILSIYQCQCCSHLSLILSTSSFSHILVCVAFFSSQISALGVFFFAEEIQLVNFWFIEPRLLDRKECWGVLEREPNSIPFVVDHPSRLLRGSNLKKHQQHLNAMLQNNKKCMKTPHSSKPLRGDDGKK